MSKEIEVQLSEVQMELKNLRAEYNDFAYMVSHELAAPFRQIEGFANIILSNHGNQLGDKTNRHFDLIIRGSRKGSDIVEALLAYSRLCTQDFQESTVECNNILDEVLLNLSAKISDSGAIFTRSEMPVIKGDSGQLNLLFYHLIHNSTHYHKTDSQPVVTIETTENAEHWEFCISDNGIGIPDKYAEKVFIAFKRAVSEKLYDGLGMGLTIARHIVRNHGGEIWLQSDASDGCAIKFTLPKRMV